MNLILGNLADLKTAVLPASMLSNTDFDPVIIALGKGVAAAMQRYCNRLFERIEDDTFERPANCAYVSLPRFPVESVSKIEMKTDEQQGFFELPANTALTINNGVGLVEFGSLMGDYTDRLRVTYTGGFWANYTEDRSEDHTSEFQ